MRKHFSLAGTALALVSLAGGSAHAQVAFFDNQAAFQAASTTSLQATFEGINHEGGISDPYTEGSVTFSEPSNLYNVRPGGPAAVNDFDAPVTSNMLTVGGNEGITMTFAGPASIAVGFTGLTHRFDTPVVTVFDIASALTGTYVVTQAPGTVGFVAITSTVGIGSVRWLADRGSIKDTAIDKVYVGASAVPEPATHGLMLGGIAPVGVAARRGAART